MFFGPILIYLLGTLQENVGVHLWTLHMIRRWVVLFIPERLPAPSSKGAGEWGEAITEQ